jgi:hypothetical protein
VAGNLQIVNVTVPVVADLRRRRHVAHYSSRICDR